MAMSILQTYACIATSVLTVYAQQEHFSRNGISYDNCGFCWLSYVTRLCVFFTLLIDVATVVYILSVDQA